MANRKQKKPEVSLMRFFRFEGIKSESWGWDENPVNGGIYSMDELEKMYGKCDTIFSTVLSTWEDEDWTPDHGKWIEVAGKEASNV